jgi:hypothetical protein
MSEQFAVRFCVVLALVLPCTRVRASSALDASSSTGAIPENAVEGSATGSVSSYADTDDIHVVTPEARAEVHDAGRTWNVEGGYAADVVAGESVVLDVVSAASPLVPADGVVHWHEVRQAGSLEGTYQPHAFGVGANAAVSSEPDCFFVAGGGRLIWDVVPSRWRLFLGYTRDHDVNGRAGTALDVFSHTFDEDRVAAGVTVLPSSGVVLGFEGDLILQHGDASSPYRHLPLFTPAEAAAIPKGASVARVNDARIPLSVAESLPTSRGRYALTAQLEYRTSVGVLRARERLYADSWELYASTTDVGYGFRLSSRWVVRPGFRVHGQSATYFWDRAYITPASGVLPRYRTGDRELGPLVTVAGGAFLGFDIGSSKKPDSWTLFLDVNAMQTAFLDHLYVTSRTAGFGTAGLLASFE